MLEDIAAVMAEPPGRANHGRERRPISPQADGEADPHDPWRSLARPDVEEFLQDGGWTIERGTAHRGVVHPDEHVDLEHVRSLVETYLGVSLATIQDAYRNGRPTAERARTRAEIDARLLALLRKGGNMTALARVLGWDVDEDAGSRMMTRAIQRARAAEAQAA